MAKAQPEILDWAQMQIRRHDAATAMLAALKQAYLDSCVRGAMVAGQRDQCASAIAKAEAAGIKAP